MACKCQDAANNTFSCIRRISPIFNNGTVRVFLMFEIVSRTMDFCYFLQRFIEAYDMNADEYQMANIGYTMKRRLRYKFRNRLKRMVVCQDTQCVLTELGSPDNIHLLFLTGLGIRITYTYYFLLLIIFIHIVTYVRYQM